MSDTSRVSGARPAERLLRSKSSERWAAVAADALERTLADHAHCEKKASASAIALINDYPDDAALVRAMSRLAEEEIGHFREVHERLLARGGTLPRDRGDPYVKQLLRELRQPAPERKLDRLLIAAFVEARSCERFGLLRAELERRGEQDLARWFQKLESSEAGHAALFVKLAKDEFGAARVDQRLDELADVEARIVSELPIEPRMH